MKWVLSRRDKWHPVGIISLGTSRQMSAKQGPKFFPAKVFSGGSLQIFLRNSLGGLLLHANVLFNHAELFEKNGALVVQT